MRVAENGVERGSRLSVIGYVNCVVMALWSEWKNVNHNLHENWMKKDCRKIYEFIVNLCNYENELLGCKS